MASLLSLARTTARSSTSSAFRLFSTTRSSFNSLVSSTPPASLNDGEKHLYGKLFETFQPTKLVVEDISGNYSSLMVV